MRSAGGGRRAEWPCASAVPASNETDTRRQAIPSIREALILAGGRGTRLGDLTLKAPKPLLPVGGRAFLEYLVWNLRRHGVSDILLSVGYLAEQVMDHFGDGSRFGVRVNYVVERQPAGTGGAVRLAAQRSGEWLLVLNGDTLFDIDYRDLASLCDAPGAKVALALRQIEDCSRFGRVLIDGDAIIGFEEKSAPGPGLINGGVYLLHRSAVADVVAVPCSLERDVLPPLAAAGQMRGRCYDGLFIDIGLPESLARGEEILPEWMRAQGDRPRLE